MSYTIHYYHRKNKRSYTISPLVSTIKIDGSVERLYRSFWSMFGEVYSDTETAKGDLQAICDESALAVESVEKVLVEHLTLEDDSIKARIRISIDSRESVTIDDIPLNI